MRIIIAVGIIAGLAGIAPARASEWRTVENAIVCQWATNVIEARKALDAADKQWFLQTGCVLVDKGWKAIPTRDLYDVLEVRLYPPSMTGGSMTLYTERKALTPAQ